MLEHQQVIVCEVLLCCWWRWNSKAVATLMWYDVQRVTWYGCSLTNFCYSSSFADSRALYFKTPYNVTKSYRFLVIECVSLLGDGFLMFLKKTLQHSSADLAGETLKKSKINRENCEGGTMTNTIDVRIRTNDSRRNVSRDWCCSLWLTVTGYWHSYRLRSKLKSGFGFLISHNSATARSVHVQCFV